MNKDKVSITIIGAGISGLSTAYWLNQSGFKINLLESNKAVGGTIKSKRERDYLIDFGPNSGLETTPLISELVNALKIEQELVYANDKANKRYILKNNKLYALPTGFSEFLNTKLFSLPAKLNLLREPLRRKSVEGYYQSVSEFVKRRLGQEFLDYAVNPFISGIFAGDPDWLSVQSALPRLYRLEDEYGSLIKGMIKGAKERKSNPEKSKQAAKMFSFRNGMQTITDALSDTMKDRISLGATVKNIEKKTDGYEISYLQSGEAKSQFSNIVISTAPCHKAKNYLKAFDPKLSSAMQNIYYPPVGVLYLGFQKEAIKRPLDGFGFLIPAKEEKKFLGAIWSSSLFPGRAPEGHVSFSLFIGGARNAQIFSIQEEVLIHQVILEFKQIMQIKDDPEFIRFMKWNKAIPQYNIGYIEQEEYFSKFENMNPGVFLGGNYRGGISIGDSVKNSKALADRVSQFILENRMANVM